MGNLPQLVMRPFDWLLLIILSMLWGGSFFFVGIAVKFLQPLTIVLFRVGFAAVLLSFVLILFNQSLPMRITVWKSLIAMGLINNVTPFSLIVWGQVYIPSSLAAVLNSTTPLFTVIIAHKLTEDEKISIPKMVGVLLGILGVSVMLGMKLAEGAGISLVAQGAVLCAAISYSFAGVYGKRFHSLGLTSIQTAAGQLIASTLVLLPIVLIVDRPWRTETIEISAVLAIFGLAVLSTAIAYILYFRILERAGATNLLLVTFLIPVSAVLLGTLILNETLESNHLIGMIFIGLGLLAVDGRALKVRKLLNFGKS